MKSPTQPLSASDIAVDWSIRRASGLTPSEQRSLDGWLASDPAYPALLAAAEQTVGILRRPRPSANTDAILHELRSRQQQRRVRRRSWVYATAGLAAAAALAVAFLPLHRLGLTGSAVATVESRPDLQVLPDGSTVRLNAGAEIQVSFTTARRDVTLLQGEALFSVTKDAARPFTVTSAGIAVRAVGTEFSVRQAARAVDVLVTEGRVAVMRTESAAPDSTAQAAEPPIYVAAGSRVSVPLAEVAPTAVQPVTSEEINQSLAWLDQRVEFSGTPLGEAVELFNHQNKIQLVLADPALAGHRISGVFWKDDPEAFAKLLEMSLAVSAERNPGRIEFRGTSPK